METKRRRWNGKGSLMERWGEQKRKKLEFVWLQLAKTNNSVER